MPNRDVEGGSDAFVPVAAPKMNPDGLLSVAPGPNDVEVVVGAAPNGVEVFGAAPNDVEAVGTAPNEGFVGGAPNAGLLKLKEGVVVFGAAGSDVAAGWPNVNPVDAGLGSSLGAGAAPKVNDDDDVLVVFPNKLLADAAGAGFALVLPKVNPMDDAGLSLFAVAPNPKLGAEEVVVVLVFPFAFPNIPLVAGAAFEAPKEPPPKRPPDVPFVGAAGATGVKPANGFGFGCSCCCCPNKKPLLVPFPNEVEGAGAGTPPKLPPNVGAGDGDSTAPFPKAKP